MTTLEKVYCVTFMRYTNVMKDTVSDWDGKGHCLAGCEYLDVGKESFLLRESQLEYYRKFGGGYRNIEFVGQIPVSNREYESHDISKVDYQYVDGVPVRVDPPSLADVNSTGTVPPPPGVTITCTNNGET